MNKYNKMTIKHFVFILVSLLNSVQTIHENFFDKQKTDIMRNEIIRNILLASSFDVAECGFYHFE